MKKAIWLVLFAAMLSACAGTPRKLYEGPERKPTELSNYSLWNFSGFFSGPQIYTVSVDANITERTGGFVSILPGTRTVRVSFRDHTNVMMPALMKAYTFQGWYDITFVAKPGKSYAPIFNQNLPPEDQVHEMCIAEFNAPADLAQSRQKQQYLACSPPSISPTAENIKLCQDAVGGRSKIYEEFCFKHK